LWRAIREKRTVVYVSRKLRCGWVFHSDGRVVPFFTDDYKKQEELDDPNCVFLCDSLEPPSVRAFTVLATSPKRDRWKEFR
jgi:hypothetical protein